MTEKLEKDVRTLRRAVWGLGGVVAVLTATLLVAAAAPEPRDLTVRSVSVVDGNGVVRAVLSGRLPDPVGGPRIAPAAGLVLNGPTGMERGGYMTTDQGDEAVLSLDDATQGEVFKVVANPRAGASLFLPHQDGALIALTTYRGAPELHLLDKDGATQAILPEGTAALQ